MSQSPSPVDNLLDPIALMIAFEQGHAPEGFHHADHVRMAFTYVTHYPFLDAVAKFCAALRNYAAAHNQPRLYHETITWAYLVLIRERIARAGRPVNWEEFAADNPDLLVWRGGLLSKLYRQETLDSDFARHTFVLPDRGL